MRLVLRRAGAMAGLIARPPNHVDTSDLAITKRERLYRLVADSRIHELPRRLARSNRDEISYELAITHDDGTQLTVEFTHSTASPQLRALVTEIDALRVAMTDVVAEGTRRN